MRSEIPRIETRQARHRVMGRLILILGRLVFPLSARTEPGASGLVRNGESVAITPAHLRLLRQDTGSPLATKRFRTEASRLYYSRFSDASVGYLKVCEFPVLTKANLPASYRDWESEQIGEHLWQGRQSVQSDIPHGRLPGVTYDLHNGMAYLF